MSKEFTISIKSNNFCVETEDNIKNMKCVYYINYDSDYDYLFNYIKENGNVSIFINHNIEKIYVSTMMKDYSYEYYEFDGDFDSPEKIDEYDLGYNCLEFYKYYFYE